MGKSTISMVIFNSFLYVYQRVFNAVLRFLAVSPKYQDSNTAVKDRSGRSTRAWFLARKYIWGWVKTLVPNEPQNSW